MLVELIVCSDSESMTDEENIPESPEVPRERNQYAKVISKRKFYLS